MAYALTIYFLFFVDDDERKKKLKKRVYVVHNYEEWVNEVSTKEKSDSKSNDKQENVLFLDPKWPLLHKSPPLEY